MPSLSSLPSPISSFFNNNRWAELPQSENAQTELLNSRARQLITANLTLPRTSSIPFPRVLDKSDYAHLGDLLRQEHLAGSSQMLCHYRNISSSAGRDRPAPSPISLICELGCCANSPGGCCTVDDPSGHSGTNTPASYHWAILLLSVFILCVLISTLVILVLYWTNRRHEKRLHRRMLAEKCFSVLGSSSDGGSYRTPTVLGSDPGPTPHHSQLFHPAFRHFFDSPTPSIGPRVGLPRHQFASSSAVSPPHLLRTCRFHPHHHSPSPPSSSAYYAPDEVFFRSSF